MTKESLVFRFKSIPHCLERIFIKFKNNIQQQIKSHEQHHELFQQYLEKTDPVLLEAYVGPHYAKITKQRFNLPGFFFTNLYLFYRKMYWSASVLFAIDVLLFILTHNFVPDHTARVVVDIFHQLAICLLVGFLVNRYYLYLAKRKIAKLKIKYPNRSRAELKGICNVKGGISVPAVIVSVILEALISALVFVFLTVEGVITTVTESIERVEHTIQTELEHEFHPFGRPHQSHHSPNHK